MSFRKTDTSTAAQFAMWRSESEWWPTKGVWVPSATPVGKQRVPLLYRVLFAIGYVMGYCPWALSLPNRFDGRIGDGWGLFVGRLIAIGWLVPRSAFLYYGYIVNDTCKYDFCGCKTSHNTPILKASDHGTSEIRQRIEKVE